MLRRMHQSPFRSSDYGDAMVKCRVRIAETCTEAGVFQQER